MIDQALLHAISNLSVGALAVVFGYSFTYHIFTKVFTPLLNRMIEKLAKDHEEIKEMLLKISK